MVKIIKDKDGETPYFEDVLIYLRSLYSGVPEPTHVVITFYPNKHNGGESSFEVAQITP